MTDRSLTRLAWSLCALTLLVLASSLLLILLGWSTPLPQGLRRGGIEPSLWLGSSARPSSAASSPRAVPATRMDGCGSASDWA